MRSVLRTICRLTGVLILAGSIVSVFAQESGKSTNRDGTSKSRRQAYLRFMEAQRLRNEAQRSQNASRLQEAIDGYKDAIRLDPSASEPHVDLGELYFFYQSRLDLAEAEAREAVRLDASSLGGHLLLARISMTALRFEKEQKVEQVDRALRAYEEVARLDSGTVEAWAMLAELYEMKNDQAQQLKALERWAASPPPNDASFYRWLMNQDLSQDQAYYELSILYRKQSRNQEALVVGRRAFELDPDSPVYSRNLIALLRAANGIEAELKAYAQLTKTSDSQALQIGYAAALIRAGRYPEAISRLTGYVKSDPANASAAVLLSVAQRRAGARTGAIETLKAGIAAAEASMRLNLMLDLGETYEELGRNDEAMAQYEQVFETFFGRGALTGQNLELFGHVLSRLARVYRRTGQPAKLQQAFSRARPLVGDRSPALDLTVIDNLREEGKRREAFELATATSRRFPDDRSVRLTEALILADMRRFTEGIDLLRGLLSGSPDAAVEDAGVYLLLSSIQMQDGRLKEAEDSIRKALALNPEDASLLIQLSTVQDRSGQDEAAEKTLRELLAREPDNSTALNNLGYFLVARGSRYQEALRLIEQAVSIEPLNGSFLDSLGWVNYRLGKIDKAREQLEKATVYTHHSATLHEHLGDVFRELGRLAEARRQWEKALEFSVEADEIARLKGKLKDLR